jgi:electron transfer flavoprotein beta subunit
LALQKIVAEEKPDLIMMGKQAVDGDSNQVGQILAELLDYPMATFAATIEEEAAGLKVSREVDGGVAVVRLKLPAVVTVDLRIVSPTSVYSQKTDRAFKYNDGVRFAPLPAIMQAKKKKLDVKALAELVADTAVRTQYRRFAPPAERKAGARVATVAELVNKLANEAKVI